MVTSEFGNRIHPITDELRLHKGIDKGLISVEMQDKVLSLRQVEL